MTRLARRLVEATPSGLRAPVRDAARQLGRATARWRPLPDFLVIGTKRGGTTTLFRALQDHPQVLPMFPSVQAIKSPHYFDHHFHRGEAWYRGHFPIRSDRARLTGESSPYYLFHPLAPRRVHDLVPDVRLIALLRDPVTRALSHYWDRVKNGIETLGFEEAIEAEEGRIGGERERLLAGETVDSPAHEHFSYLARGLYADQLASWFAFFPREQVLVLRSEDLYADPAAIHARTLDFLGLPPHRQAGGYGRLHGHADRPSMRSDTEQLLRAWFAPHNERLARLLGTDLWWPAA